MSQTLSESVASRRPKVGGSVSGLQMTAALRGDRCAGAILSAVTPRRVLIAPSAVGGSGHGATTFGRIPCSDAPS